MSTECTFEELDAHEQNGCFYPKGGNSAAFVLKEGHGITDFANATQWTSAINAGTARIFTPIKGEFPEPTAVEGENVTACGPDTILDGFDNVFDWKDFNVNATNDEVYGQLNRSEFSGFGWYNCSSEQIRVIERGVNFVATPASSPVSNKEKQFYHAIAKWSTSVQDSFPVLYEAPVGIFS